MTSPADRYRAAKELARYAELASFELTYDFPFDGFQIKACRAIEGGHGVLVAAPTGSGKTVVGEFAVFLALNTGRKAFYTTPIKALSNQKYVDLVARHGAEKVGLLTGDQNINGGADIVVMTTEVLRNMIYAGSSALVDLGFVVMDEVHYLADRFRGPVWEEVIIHLDPTVQLVSLSATVSNAEEFGDWLAEVRGDMEVIVSETRPVPLWQHVLIGRDMLYLHAREGGRRLNPELVERANQAARSDGQSFTKRAGHRGKRPPSGQRSQTKRSTAVPSRVAVLHQLKSYDLLPAIYFIFSRAGCDGAVDQCRAASLSLTTNEERLQIRKIVEDRCVDIPREDLSVLGYWSWLESLESGIAAHHAGLLPVFKETVEALFSAGLVKIVFATETLALGINMPARTVVLEKLVKWDGTGHQAVTAGEYTQLTGRAGRRGMDIEGHALVVYHRGLELDALSGLAAKRTYPLRSAFRPTYNMAVNLIASSGYERTREILEMSFAQFQADRSVVGLARQVQDHREALDGYADAMACDRGDFVEYAALRRAISERESQAAKGRSQRRRQEAERSVEGLRRGDVVEVPVGRHGGFGIVIDAGVAERLDLPRPRVLMADRNVQMVEPADLRAPIRVIGQVHLDSRVDGRTAPERRELAASLRSFLIENGGGAKAKVRPAAAVDEEVAELERRLRDHPCHDCPDREGHARWAYRWAALEKENHALLRKIEGRTSSIAKVFDRVAALLVELKYLEDDKTVSSRGLWLRRIYVERDLLLAESLLRGGWEKLSPSELAAMVTTMVFESRRPEGVTHHELGPLASERLRTSVSAAQRIWAELDGRQRHHGLEPTAAIDSGLVVPMYLWAEGKPLRTVLRSTELAPGDFVRWAKQVLDILDQLGAVAPFARVRSHALEASQLVRRGVVSYSSI